MTPNTIIQLAKDRRSTEASFAFDTVFPHFSHDRKFLMFGVRLFLELGNRDRVLNLLNHISNRLEGDVEAAFFLLSHYEKMNATRELATTAASVAKMFPKNIKIRSEQARILQTMGDFEGSDKIFEKILRDIGPDAQIYRMHVISVHGADMKLFHIKNMELLWRKKNLPEIDRINLGFALGKIFDERGDVGKALYFLKHANDLQARLYPYDLSERISEARKLLVAQRVIRHVDTETHSEFTPVFITGMPRSGTTVIENRLLQAGGFQTVGEASIAHPAVYRFFASVRGFTDLEKASIDGIRAFGAYCRSQLKMRSPEMASGIIDKSMRNFLISGYLVSALPDARMMFIKRNPLDIAQSLYRNYFAAGSHRYANRIEDMAHEIALYDAVTDRFLKMGSENIVSVAYEDFASTPKEVMAEIRNFTGVSTPDHTRVTAEGEIAIKTLSLHQARQPVHTGRIAAWTRYKDMLDGFPEAYGEAKIQIENLLRTV